ncbi:hypothetical protein ACSS6W_005702 [Trichoderma asperelloides]
MYLRPSAIEGSVLVSILGDLDVVESLLMADNDPSLFESTQSSKLAKMRCFAKAIVYA